MAIQARTVKSCVRANALNPPRTWLSDGKSVDGSATWEVPDCWSTPSASALSLALSLVEFVEPVISLDPLAGRALV